MIADLQNDLIAGCLGEHTNGVRLLRVADLFCGAQAGFDTAGFDFLLGATGGARG